MVRITHWLVVAFILLLSHARVVKAAEAGTNEGFDFSGSLRTITAATANYDYSPLFGQDNPTDGFSQTILRRTVAGHILDWLSYELHGVHSMSFSSFVGSEAPGSSLFGGGDFDSRYRFMNAGWVWVDEDDLKASMWLDRCNLKIMSEVADITVGRQAITFGKAYFWNPLDTYLAFDPRQFDRDYKAGVDAVRIDIALGDFSGINLVGVLGRKVGVLSGYTSDAVMDASWHGSSLLVRIFGTLFDWDLALQGGKVYGGYQLGAAFSGELGPLAARMETAYHIAQNSDALPLMPDEPETQDHLTAVVGLGYHFANTLDIQAEYLYNGLGDPDNLEAAWLRMGSGISFHLGRHLLGLVASYDILPILSGSLAWIFSFSDTSSLIQPGLSLSVADEVDFVFGALIALGARPTDVKLHSEFGTYPNIYYMEFKFYF